MALPDIDGVAGTSITAHCLAPVAGEGLTAGQVQAYLQEIENDIATIASGNVTISGTKTFSGTAVVARLTSAIVLFDEQDTAAENHTGTGSFVDSTVNVLTLAGCHVNDVIEVHVSGAYTCNNTATVQAFLYQDYGGGGQSLHALQGSAACSAAGTTATPFSIHAMRTITTAGTVRVILRLKANAAATLTVSNTLAETEHGGSFVAKRYAIG